MSDILRLPPFLPFLFSCPNPSTATFHRHPPPPMPNVTVQDYATPALKKLLGSLRNRAPLMARLGRQLESSLRDHFAQREGQPNKNGWKKKHFWSGIRTTTALTEVTNAVARVTIGSPAILLKIYGGTVRPRTAKALAIPLCEEAYSAGMPRAGKLQGTFIFRAKSGKAFIARAKPTAGPGAPPLPASQEAEGRRGGWRRRIKAGAFRRARGRRARRPCPRVRRD